MLSTLLRFAARVLSSWDCPSCNQTDIPDNAVCPTCHRLPPTKEGDE